MKIIGHFTEDNRLPDNLKNQNVFPTSNPEEFRCPTENQVFTKEVLNSMESLGLFVYDHIEIEKSAVEKITTKSSFLEKMKKGEKKRFIVYSIIILIMLLINAFLIFYK